MKRERRERALLLLISSLFRLSSVTVLPRLFSLSDSPTASRQRDGPCRWAHGHGRFLGQRRGTLAIEIKKHRTFARPFVELEPRGREMKIRNELSVTLSLSLCPFAHLPRTPYALKHSINTAPRRRWIQARGPWYPNEVRFFSFEIVFFFFPLAKRQERGEEGLRRKREKKLGPLVLASPSRCRPLVSLFLRADSIDTHRST